jgi:cytoskeletal protein CcmA (bactofilin family)
MFAKRPKAPRIEATKLTSLIAEDVEITGDLRFTHGIRIDGHIKGNVVGRCGNGTDAGSAAARTLLVLSDKGRIAGNVRCGDAVINGSIVGDLHVEHFLELKSSSQVSGTIHYEYLQMDVGATVRGHLEKAGLGAPIDAPAALAREAVVCAIAQSADAEPV